MSTDEIEKDQFLKYAGSFILSCAAIAGLIFGLNNYFLTIREHTEFKERIDTDLQRFREIQENSRVPRTEFEMHIQMHKDIEDKMQDEINRIEERLITLEKKAK